MIDIKQFFKQGLFFCICFSVFFLTSTVSASAKTYTDKDLKTFYPALEQQIANEFINNFENLKSRTENGKTYYYIDISDFDIDKNNQNSKILTYFNTYSIYTGDKINIKYLVFTETTYTSLVFETNLSKSEIKKHINIAETQINKIVKEVNKQKTTVRKVLYLHDYMVSNAENYKINDDAYYHNSRCMLLNNKGVCSAYTYLFANILHRANIDCVIAYSDKKMNHCWNMVKIGSYWYHIDVTWDDAGPNKLGRVSRQYFLLSDKEIVKTHKNWDKKGLIKCTKTYNAYWRNVNSPVVLRNNYAYYIKGDKLIRRNLDSGKTKTLVKKIGTWYVWNKKSVAYSGTYSGLFTDGTYLYFNTPSKIKKYSFKTGKIYTVKTISIKTGYIYGIKKDGKNIKYQYQKAPSNKGSIKTIKNVTK